MKIIETDTGRALEHNGQTTNLLALPVDAVVHGYDTPQGLWAGVQEAGKPRPVYAGAGGVKIGTVDLPADPVAALEEKRQSALERLKGAIDSKLRTLINEYPEHESATWPTAVEESRAIVAGTATDTPHVTASAAESGLTVNELAQTIVNNANNYAAASGRIVGLRIKVKESIKAATSEAEINAALELLND